MSNIRDDDPENFHLVRRYSELERTENPEEPLSQGLALKVDSDVERERKGIYHVEVAFAGLFGEDGQDPKYYDNLAISKLAELETKSKELETTYQTFVTKLKISKNASNNQKPDINVVRIAIQNAQVQMIENQESKLGRFKAFFGRSAQALDDYNYLFALLPAGDKYTSVFTGALSSVVRASVTHAKIADEISNAFDKIAEQVRSFCFIVKNYPDSTYIKCYISLFYYELFGFLIVIMRDWYQSSWKRLSHAFGDNFLETTVQGTLQTLQQYTDLVEKEDKRRERENTKRQLFAVGSMVQELLVHQAKDKTALERSLQALHSEFESLKKIGSPSPPSALGGSDTLALEAPPHLLEIKPSWTKDTIKIDTENLKQYLQTTSDLNKLVNISQSLAVSTDLSIRIHKWITITSSEALWIEGPAGLSYPTQSTLASAFILGALRQVGIPVMVDFIQYTPRYWNPETEFVKVVYSLIYQAALAVTESSRSQLTSQLDFSTSRWQKLTGDIATLPEALDILADLLAIGPPLLFCVIDGLQVFDGRHLSIDVRRSMRHFVALLCKAVQNSQGEDRVFKVLFTTEGYVQELVSSASRRLLSRESYDLEEEDELLKVDGIDTVR